MNDFEVGPFDPQRDGPAVDALWTQVFGAAKGGQTPAWLFRDGPAGAPPRMVARKDGRAVAHAGAMPLRLSVGGQVVHAGWSVGAMTDPAQRGKGLFVRVGQALYGRMAAEGFGLVGGFSNANSASLHTSTLGRTALRPFPWCVRPLLPRRVGLASAAVGWPDAVHGDVRIAAIQPTDPRLDAVWARLDLSAGIGAVRDTAFAAWRYADRPDADYRLALATRGGQAAAWLAVRALRVARVPALFVADLAVAPGEEQAGKQLLAAAHAWGARSGCAIGSALLPGWGPARSVLRSAGYLQVPEPLHPQRIVLSVKALAPLPMAVDSADRWWLAWSDTDLI
ncbi:MAG: GNAT family N-acetyltransferase [Deltaproteobacteria bacterium]|nr:GNAT family N-acetyltransferase [Deltaproteobacteria bacterium]